MGQESTSVSDALRALRARHRAQADAFGPDRYLVATAGDLGVWTSRIIAGLDRVTDDDAWFFRVREEGH